MSVYRAQIGFVMDSALPRDVVCINPHYEGDDAQGLANQLKTNLIANSTVGATTPFKVKIYDAQKPPPSYPLAEASQAGSPLVTSHPRELALCLSYYAGFNRPHFRGRLYIPIALVGGSTGLRPTGTQMNNVGAFATTLKSGLPAGTNWVLYSRKTGGPSVVSDWWVDDEWDVMRSRGLKSTSRVTGTVIP